MTVSDAKNICMSMQRRCGGCCGMGSCEMFGLCTVLSSNDLAGFCQKEEYEDYELVDTVLEEYLIILKARLAVGQHMKETGRYGAEGLLVRGG